MTTRRPAEESALALRTTVLDTPIGPLLVAVDEVDRLRVVHFDPAGDLEPLLARACGGQAVRVMRVEDPAGCASALRAYFAGDCAAVEALAVAPVGTAFQREVWAALRTIPCGATIGYGELARRLGRPAASRAVGLANGANPIAVVIPCHRVIGATGALTGYGGGLERKRWLLAHEGRRWSLF